MMDQARKSRAIPFLTEEEPAYGVPTELLPGIRRIVARNPGVMTYFGTNTYLIDNGGDTIVIDPGPDCAQHVEAVLSAATGRISDILLSHGHGDHAGAVAQLHAASGARLHAAGIPPATDVVVADIELIDGNSVGPVKALATPGHTLDHFCFLIEDRGLIFSGDHVLTWSSSIVTARHGNMREYMRSLQLLIDRDDDILLPGHGPIMQRPREFYQALLDLRIRRENQIVDALSSGRKTLDELVGLIYPHQTHPKSIEAAGLNLISHLRKLVAENRAFELAPKVWARADE